MLILIWISTFLFFLVLFALIGDYRGRNRVPVVGKGSTKAGASGDSLLDPDDDDDFGWFGT
jgi:hypothetical protein